MRTKIVLTIVTSLIMYFAYSQDQEPQEPQGNQFKGVIFNSDGTETTGIIETNLSYPWITQKYIRFFDDSLLNGDGRVKLKDKPKLDAKDIKGFKVEEKEYESHKYSDLSSLGPKAAGAFYFFEVVTNGPIKLYYYYESPPLVMEGDPEVIYKDLRDNPQLMVKKGDAKLGPLSASSLEKLISDCPEVAAKYSNGEYGNKVKQDEDDSKKKSKLGKLINKVANTPSINSYAFEVVTEYNSIMSNQ